MRKKRVLWAELSVFVTLVCIGVVHANTTSVSEKLNPFATGSSTHPGNNLGISVALDGQRALVGIENLDASVPSGYGRNGAGYLFEFGTSWEYTEELLAYEAILSNTGFTTFAPPLSSFSPDSVDVDDGVVVLGAESMSNSLGAEGSIFIHEQDTSGSWNGDIYFASDPISGLRMGESVATHDGVVAAGAMYAESPRTGMTVGAVYTFEKESGAWTEQEKLVPADDPVNSSFGGSIAMAGNYMVVGASFDQTPGTNAGSAYVFEKNASGNWIETFKLTSSDIPSSLFFGQSVAISGDTIVVGSFKQAHVFTLTAQGVWAPETLFTHADLGVHISFGRSVAVSGGTIAVSAPSTSNTAQGSVLLFDYNATSGWNQTHTLEAADGALGDGFGTSLSMSDGNLLIGRDVDSSMGANNGSAYIYALNDDFDNDGIPNDLDLDDDNDGMPDVWELQYGLNAYDASNATDDLDGDGRNDLQEFLDSTDPTVFDQPPAVPTVKPVQIGRGVLLDELSFTVTLDAPLPSGYGVFINFDNQQGDWYEQGQDGGHFELPAASGNSFTANYVLNKPGLRSVRAGVFRLATGGGQNDDSLIADYSEATTCTESVCLNGIVKQDGIGNSDVLQSGSQLVDQVDIASGNYHLSAMDLGVVGKGVSFAFSRAYNALSSTPWTFGYEARVRYLPDSFQREVSVGPKDDGRYQYYFKEMDYLGGKWYPLDSGNFDQLVENADGSFSQYTRGDRVYQYSAPTASATESTGQLVRIEDRLGYGLDLSHVAGKLSGLTDANARSYSVQRDSNGRIISVSDSANRSVSYSYNAAGLLSGYTNARGFTTSFGYIGNSSAARLQTVTDPKQNVLVTIAYNASGQVQSLVNAVSDTTTFIYDRSDAISGEGSGVVKATVNGINHSKIYLLDDERRCVTGVIDAENAGDFRSDIDRIEPGNRNQLARTCLVSQYVSAGNRSESLGTNYTYTEDGRAEQISRSLSSNQSLNLSLDYRAEQVSQPNLRPVESESRAGIAVPRTYSSFSTTGKARTITDSRGAITSRVFDGNDWVTEEKDPLNRTTVYTYFATGLVKSETDAAGNVTRYEYDAVGRLIKSTSPLGLVSTYQFDKNGNVTLKRHRATGIDYTTTYQYDNADNLTRMVDPRLLVTNYSYDAMNRKIQETYTVAGEVFTSRYDYDALGRIYRLTDQRNNQRLTYYTARNLVSRRQNGQNQLDILMTYDGNGNVATVTDGEQRTTTYVYDSLNRRIRATDAQGDIERWQYFDSGWVSSYEDKEGRIATYEYDEEGNLVETTEANGNTTEAQYDSVGNVISITDANNNKTTYTYDVLNRRTSTVFPDGNRWLYGYDANGNMVSQTTPTGEIIQQQFDALNRVVSRTERAANAGTITRQISYTYDANGNMLTQSEGGNSISYTYDAINRVTQIRDQYGLTVGYGYDKAGNRTSITYPGNVSVNYTYDGANRLSSLQDWLGNTTSYTRNSAGQLTSQTNSNGTTATYSFDSKGQLTQLKNTGINNSVISEHALTYDDVGNITSIMADQPLLSQVQTGATLFEYDDNNFIVKANTTNFDVDTAGRLVEEDGSGQDTVYQFNVNDLITQVTKGTQTTASYEYDLQDNRIKQVQSGIEQRYVIDQLAQLPNVIAQTDAQGVIKARYIYGEGLVSRVSASSDVHYYHFDQTGNTVALTNASGLVTDQYGYTPYGGTSAAGATDNPFQYVGRYGVMDDGNGLHYMRARYYREDLGRFLSLDKLEGDKQSPQTLNRYSYTQGRPLTHIDPSGLCTGQSGQGSCSSPGIMGPNVPNVNKTAWDGTVPFFSTAASASISYVADVASNRTVPVTKWAHNKYFVKGVYTTQPEYISHIAYKPAYTKKVQKVVKSGVNKTGAAVTVGVTTSLSVYGACKYDTTSTHCTATMASVLAGNVAGAGVGSVAAIACLPATPAASAICGAVIGTAFSYAVEKLVYATLVAESNSVPAPLTGVGSTNVGQNTPLWDLP